MLFKVNLEISFCKLVPSGLFNSFSRISLNRISVCSLHIRNKKLVVTCWIQMKVFGTYLNVDWNPFNILKWNAGVKSFRRANHFSPLLVKSPSPKSVCTNLYAKLFSMCFGLVTIFCRTDEKYMIRYQNI